MKDKVRPVVPAVVVIPNAAFVRRDKYKRLSFELTEQQYNDLIAKSEALLPNAITIPIVYDDFKEKRVIRGKAIKESGIEVDDDESLMPVIDDDHTMTEGAYYKVRGSLKATHLGQPPTPCVYFAITMIDPIGPLLEVLPGFTHQEAATIKPPKKVATTAVKPASALKPIKKAKKPAPVTVEDGSESGSDDEQSQTS